MATGSITVWATRLLLLSLVAFPVAAQAQFAYGVTNGAITITGYSGPGGAVVIPSEVNSVPVTGIGTNAFSFCLSLTSITIPSTVTSIGKYAFWNCTGLSNVVIGNSVITIGDEAFNSCSGLTSVTIPDSVLSIGKGAFASLAVGTSKWVSSLTNVTIGNSVTNIGYQAFWQCYELTSITIPGSVTTIGGLAFSGCSNLANVYFKGNAPSADSSVFDDDDYATAYYLPGTSGWGPFLTDRPTVLWNAQVQASGASFGIQSNRFGFTISGNNGLPVVVEARTNLANPTWYPLQTITLSGGSFYFSDPQWKSYPGRFYRLSVP